MSLPAWTLKEIWLFDRTMAHGSLTAAAADMGMTQSAASRILSGLEGKLGAALFERLGRNLVPNEAAFSFHGRVRAVLSAVSDDLDASEGAATELRIAAPPSFANGFSQDATRLFLQEGPRFRISVEVRSTPSIVELAAEGKIDLGLTDGAVRHQSVRTIEFRRSQAACFVARENPLSQRSVLTAADLRDQCVILLTRRHAGRSHLADLIERAGVKVDRRIETSTGISALWHARSQKGVALMNAFPIQAYLPEGLVAVPFEPALSYKSVFVLPAWRGAQVPARAFMQAVRKVAEHLQLGSASAD